ncbi:MAG: antibiotic biosynthesis monooxygenase, partial [Planctomycetota bacterium]
MTHIIRVFQATTRSGQESAFQKFFIDEALPILHEHAGLVSVHIGLPPEESPQEFLMITTWRDLDALKGFAGENWTEAVIDPREAP